MEGIGRTGTSCRISAHHPSVEIPVPNCDLGELTVDVTILGEIEVEVNRLCQRSLVQLKAAAAGLNAHLTPSTPTDKALRRSAHWNLHLAAVAERSAEKEEYEHL